MLAKLFRPIWRQPIIFIESDGDWPYNKATMRLIRLFLLVLLSISLPFANVASAAMVHCAQMETTVQSNAPHHTDHSGMHAEHRVMQDQDASDPQHDLSSSQNSAECSNCSYCQSCASAIVPPLSSQSWRIEAPPSLKSPLTSLVPRIFLEEPFRPPALAFA